MDAETIRLLITAGVALVAGLGGAGVTATINRRNTLDTLQTTQIVAERQLEEAADREHAVWLRNQKQEAYSDFMRAAQSIQHAVTRSSFDAPADANPDELAVARGRIKMLGAPSVRTSAVAIEREVSKLYICHERLVINLGMSPEARESMSREESRRMNADTDRTLDAYFASREKLNNLMIQFVIEVRKDLGTTTPDDAELDAANRKLIVTHEDVAAMNEEEKLENPDDNVLA